MKITHKNKDLIQSYILTTAKYDFSAYEKRILYRIIEVLQAKTKGLKLNYDYSLQKDLFEENTQFTLPISCFLKDEKDNNYHLVRKALRDLRNKDFEYEDEKEWGVYSIIEMPKHYKYKSAVQFTITPLLLGAFLNFSQGYRKYELQIAMQFESVYAMRFYELFSGKNGPIIYGIEQLKEMFKLDGKYKRINDFFKRVIDPAKKELDKVSPYSFDYETIKTGRKITHIKFKPYPIEKNRDKILEHKKLTAQTSIRWELDKKSIGLLKSQFDFTDKGLKNNRALLKKAFSDEKIEDYIATIQGMIRKYSINNKSGFFISEIRKFID